MNKYEKGYNILKKSYEKFFNTNTNNNSFEFFDGKINNVIFSCPHAVSQTREGKEKMADINTGPLGYALNSLGYSVLIKTKNCNDDANYDKKSSFKDYLTKYIKDNDVKYLIDLHGMSKKRNVMISLGTCFGSNSDKSIELTNQFIKLAHKNGLDAEKIRVDFPFYASRRTVSSSISRKNKIETLQIEINSKIFESSELTIKLIKSLDEFAKLANKIKSFNYKNIKTEEIYQIEKSFINTSSKKAFKFNNFKSEILLSAPHSCSMIKEDKECYKESFSAALGITLSKNLKLSVLYKCKPTNYDSTDEYINNINKYVTKNTKLLIEFHIMNPKRYEDITILTNQGYSIGNNFEIISTIIKSLILNNFNNFSLDYPFNAFNYNSTVSSIFKQTNTPALQFIINQKIFENKNKVKKILITINEIIKKLNYIL